MCKTNCTRYANPNGTNVTAAETLEEASLSLPGDTATP